MALGFPAMVDERVSRLTATGTALGGALALATGARWLVPLLGLGFLLRALWGSRYSLLGRAAQAIARRRGTPRPVPGPPKQLAQALGATFMLSATLLFGLRLDAAGWALVAMLTVFAALEAAFGFCLACRLLALLRREERAAAPAPLERPRPPSLS